MSPLLVEPSILPNETRRDAIEESMGCATLLSDKAAEVNEEGSAGEIADFPIAPIFAELLTCSNQRSSTATEAMALARIGPLSSALSQAVTVIPHGGGASSTLQLGPGFQSVETVAPGYSSSAFATGYTYNSQTGETVPMSKDDLPYSDAIGKLIGGSQNPVQTPVSATQALEAHHYITRPTHSKGTKTITHHTPRKTSAATALTPWSAGLPGWFRGLQSRFSDMFSKPRGPSETVVGRNSDPSDVQGPSSQRSAFTWTHPPIPEASSDPWPSENGGQMFLLLDYSPFTRQTSNVSDDVFKIFKEVDANHAAASTHMEQWYTQAMSALDQAFGRPFASQFSRSLAPSASTIRPCVTGTADFSEPNNLGSQKAEGDRSEPDVPRPEALHPPRPSTVTELDDNGKEVPGSTSVYE